jgi:Caspase domain
VRSTNASNEGATSIRAADLAQLLKEKVPIIRRFLILDCCFSASINKEFQSGSGQAATRQLLEELPENGTALLCSSSSSDVSLAPENAQYTMFSGALLQALKSGNSQFGPKMSLEELVDLVRQELRNSHADSAPRPELHAPGQSKGNISRLPIFPNAGRKGPPAPPPPPPPPLPLTPIVKKRSKRLRNVLIAFILLMLFFLIVSAMQDNSGGGSGYHPVYPTHPRK